ncbi:PBP domain-containing protein [Nostoc sp. DSM 114160]|jgi:phosphate transport system substrate-binding protein
MWQQEKKDTSIVRLLLWVALATTPMAASLVVSAPMLAQSTPEATSSPLPQTVQNEPIVRIDGSSSLSAINQSLKESFEKQFIGKKVEVAANGTEKALKDLLDGKIDIVAMGRGLTPAEKAQGLEQVRLQREKIAIVVGAENPFKGSLTSKQFARIFRGQITNWSQLGGPSAKIRFIDRPNTSETRNTFRTYPAFKTAEFATGANATQVSDDNTAEIIKQLGKDGISYVLANQVSKLKDVRVLQLHQALPSDARYPFSQPLVYVYKKDQSLTAVDFLGFTLAPAGQQAIEKGRAAEAEAIAASVLQPAVAASPGVQTTPAPTPSPSATSSAFGEQPFVAAPTQSAPIVNKETPLWLLLPVFFITVAASLLVWILKKRPSPTEETDNLPESNPHPPNGETAALNASTVSSLNGTTLEEQAVPHFQEQETPDRTPFNIYAQTQSDLNQNVTQETANLVQETSNGTSNLYEGATSSVANGSENNNLGAAALGGAAIATGIGTATWSTFNNKETETDAIDETVNHSNYTETYTPESDEIAWDIEAPAAVVNTSYPYPGNIPEELSDVELPSSEVTAPLPELPDVPQASSDFGYWDTAISEDRAEEELQAELNWLESITSTEDTASVDELPLAESDETTADVEASETDTSSLLDLPEFPEDVLSQDALNVVADAAEPTLSLPESELPAEPTVGEANSTDLAAAAALAAGAGVGAWASTFGADAPNETIAVDADEESSIVLTPHTYTSAHVSWEISPAKKAELWQQGGTQLAVRLYDVTGIDLSYQTPQLVKQYECAETADDRVVEIPQTDRDYIAEIGYIAYGEHWLFIARSAIVRIFSPVNPDPIVDDVAIAGETANGLVDTQEESSIVLTPDTDGSAHVAWKISEAKKAALRQQGGSQLIVRLYDVTGIDLSYQTPQLVKLYESEETESEGLVDIPLNDRDYIAEIGYLADGERWLFIARSAIVRVFGPVNPDPVVDDVAIAEQAERTDVDLVDVQQESSIVLTPRTFQWAEVSWEISEAKKAALRQQGGSQLVVRLYDVTGIDLSYQTPQFVQQYECEETAHDRFVEIPISDRDYIAEIGYVADGGRWLFIARSAIVRVFSPVPTEPTTDSTVENVPLVSETAVGLANVEAETAPEESSIVLTPRTPKWAYVSWHISKAQSEALHQQGGSQLAVRLYDVTGIDLSYQSPQLVQQYESEEVARDRFVAIPVSDRDYMVEIGYIADGDRWLLIARSANVRVFSRPHGDFWFVADAELIIHGATQPNTNVNIGGHAIKVKPDGTFHLRLPFSDGLMDYLIVVAADGESTRTIHKKFSQETSES